MLPNGSTLQSISVSLVTIDVLLAISLHLLNVLPVLPAVSEHLAISYAHAICTTMIMELPHARLAIIHALLVAVVPVPLVLHARLQPIGPS